MFKKFAVIAATLGMATFAVPSHATLITSGSNNPLPFSWSYNTGSSTLTGSGSLSVSGFGTSQLTVTVTLTNTSAGGQGGDRLTAFGFGIDPNATSIGFSDANDGGMVDAVLANIPSLASIEVCAIGGNNCSGGSNGGIFGGTSDTFAILLGGNWGSSVNIAPIGFKYQTGNGSFEFTASTSTSTSTSSTGGSGNQVPEPGTLGLLGLGLLGLGYARRSLSKAK